MTQFFSSESAIFQCLQSGKLSAAVGVPAGFSSGAANLPRITGGQGEASAPSRCFGSRQARRIIGRYGPFRYEIIFCIYQSFAYTSALAIRTIPIAFDKNNTHCQRIILQTDNKIFNSEFILNFTFN